VGADVASLNLGTLAYSNLLGKGPDIHAPPTMRYHNATQANAKMLDLVIMMGDNEYTPYNVSENVNSGVGRQVGNVNFQQGTKLHLLFRFVEAGTTKLAKAEHFHFTVFLRDSLEQVQVHRASTYCIPKDSVLKYQEIAPGLFAFATRSHAPGLNASSPEDPYHLAAQEQDRAVTLSFKDVFEFPISVMSVGPVKKAGVRFTFSGTPTEECRTSEPLMRASPNTPRSTKDMTIVSTATASASSTTAGSPSTTTTRAAAPTSATTGSGSSPILTTPWDKRPFNCWAGLDNQQGWSIMKRGWCCQHERFGCLNTTMRTTKEGFDCHDGLEEEWTRIKGLACCIRTGIGCLTMMQGFDCKVGLHHWRDVWSEGKKAWCCQHHEAGCPLRSGTMAAIRTYSLSKDSCSEAGLQCQHHSATEEQKRLPHGWLQVRAFGLTATYFIAAVMSVLFLVRLARHRGPRASDAAAMIAV